jgi:hypothetical protein
MGSFKFVNQNVCTVNVHEMYYEFNPGHSPIGCVRASVVMIAFLAIRASGYTETTGDECRILVAPRDVLPTSEHNGIKCSGECLAMVLKFFTQDCIINLQTFRFHLQLLCGFTARLPHAFWHICLWKPHGIAAKPLKCA